MKRYQIVTILVIIVAVLLLMSLTKIGCSLLETPSKQPTKKPAPEKKPTTKAVDPSLAKLLVADQQASRENMRRLAEGQIKKLIVENVAVNETSAVIKIKCVFGDNSNLPGYVNALNKDGHWYLTKVTREPLYPYATPSLEGVTPSLTSFGEKMVTKQQDNQSIIRDLLNNKIESFTVDKVDLRLDKSILTMTLQYKDKKTAKATGELDYKDGYWYLVNIIKK